MGGALMLAQLGGLADHAKPFHGVGSGVFEIAERQDQNADRLVYVVQLGAKLYVLHAFQKKSRLNMDSSQFAKLGHQEFQQGSEQAFTSEADVVHELKKTQVERQFLLRDAPMGPQPRAEQ